MKNGLIFKINSKIWIYPGASAWHFITLPKRHADEIKKFYEGKKRRGWGSIRVEIETANTKWKTSIFPDKQSGSYLLPIKSEVRRKEGLMSGESVDFILKTI